MKNRLLYIFAMILFLITLSANNSYVYAEDSYTYQEVWNKVINNDENYKVYNELLEKLRNNTEKINSNPLSNVKDYEYREGQEIEIDAADFSTYDYDKLLKDKKYSSELIKNNLEKSTLDLFSKILNKETNIQNSKIDIIIAKKDMEIAQLKYDLGMNLLSDMNLSKGKFEIKKSELDNLISDQTLIKQKLNNMMGSPLTQEFSINSQGLLTELNINGSVMLVPEEALKFAEENKKSLQNLADDLNDYKEKLDRYKKIYPEGSYYFELKNEELENLIKDSDDAKKQQEYIFQKSYINILDSINSINLIDLDIKTKLHEIKYYETLYKNGQISNIEYTKKSNEIASLETLKLQKALDIRKLILDYNISVIQ